LTDSRFRKHLRVPIPIVVEVRFEGEPDFLPYLLTDISWSGLYLRMEDPKPVGTSAVILLPSREGSGYRELKGKVVTQNKLVEGRTIPGVGLAFETMDENIKSLIQQLVERTLSPRT